ncbi:hypothetical protein ACFQPG_02850 [Sphingomonas sp. GCM10030256]|uniref:hypothetical protein n=1 Tax=Sphingomonas sp. GCM10030256 TaxID=3273427 RepID=UPI003609709E
MNRFLLAAGAAALAIAAPGLAQKGDKGGGHGGGHGGGKAMKAERGGGGGKQMERGGGQPAKAERRQARADRGPQRSKDREVRVARGPDRADDRGGDRVKPAKARSDQRVAKARDWDDDRIRSVRQDRREDVRIVRDRDGDQFRHAANGRGLTNGCPPGLAAKGNGCLPPGQAKKLVGAALPAALSSALLPSMYRSWYPDTDDYYYRSSGGYLYRVDRDDNLVDALLPLYDNEGYYPVGQPYPTDYNFYNVPAQYNDYYADNNDWLYRYGDGAIYQVNRSNGLIDGIVALLAGDLGVGNPLPAGYDVYNVPLSYRDRYADTNDSWYRYNDGYIYQVDPKTRIIQAVIEALV